MRKLRLSFASAKIRVAFTVASIAGMAAVGNNAARAADTCLTRPDLRAAGGHWYYRVDRVNHRHCWYQEGQASGARSARPSPASAEPTSSAPSGLSSLLASIAAKVGGAPATPVAQDNAARDPSAAETVPERTVTRRSRLAKGTDEKRIVARDTNDSRVDLNATPGPGPGQDPSPAALPFEQRFSVREAAQEPARSRSAAAETQPAAPPLPPARPTVQERAPLDTAQREMLFQEFLRWQERRHSRFW
jgi:hypothetical protein